MEKSFIETLSFVLAIAIVLLQAVLATRALTVEIRDGLRRSWRRLGAVTLVLLATVLVAVFNPRVPRSKPESIPQVTEVQPQPPPPPETELERLEEERARLRKSLEELDEMIEKLRLSPEAVPEPAPVVVPAPSPEPEPEPAPETPLGMILLLGLIAAGSACLVMLGDPSTLLPRWLRRRGASPEEKTAIDRSRQAAEALSLAADEGRYAEALQVAAQVKEELLDPGEQIDLLFVRSFCAVQLAAQAESPERRQKLLEQPLKDLEALLLRAPHLEVAEYLLAMAHGLLDEHEKALAGFRRAKEGLDKEKLPFAFNESVCLLSLAQQRLAVNDSAGAGTLFEEATALGTMADQIPLVLVENRLLIVRRSLSGGKLDEAMKGLELLRQIEGVPQDQRELLLIGCDAFEGAISFKQEDGARALQQIRSLLARILPPGLPPVSDEAAEEFLEPAVRPESLKLPRELYRTLFFLEAVLLTRAEAARGQPLTPQQAEQIALPILRALQFEPRHREVLAALGALTYWFIPGKRIKGLEWVQAAVTMGVRSPTARRLLERDKARELERQDLLQYFLGASARFLTDSTLSAQIRGALVEELGRFQDFAPVLAELDQRVDSEPQSPTVQTLRERARYLQGLMADVGRRKSLSPEDGMAALRSEYTRVVEVLEAASGQLAQLDRRVIAEIGKLVLT